MKRKTSSLLLGCLLFAATAFAQNDFPCATEHLHQIALQNPDFFQKNQTLEQSALEHFSASPAAERGSQVVTVPVVVHIIHDNGAENISDAQVQQGIAWLNQAFANADYYDQGSGVDVGIQFCLAQRDPDGQASSGITRDQSALTDLEIESEDVAMKNLNRWKPKEYVNIWIVRSICSSAYGCNVTAYAYRPPFHGSNFDGIVVEADFFGTTPSAASIIAHEMGHYFGLYHTFEGGCSNGNCLSDGDRVCDTPPDQSTAALPCGQTANTCSTDTQSGLASDQLDMTWNHMDYGNRACMHDFTQGQSDRMNFFLNGARKSLLDSKGCLPPCPVPVLADFTPGDTTILAGQTLAFDNNSQNAVFFSWSLNGVPFGGQQNAAYLFDSVGIFTIKLVVQPLNSQLCEADSMLATVQVTCPAVADFTLSNLSPEEGQTVFVTNNSQNANTFEWFVNGVSQGSLLDSVLFTESGSYEIRLVAVGSFCKSSATQSLFVRDSCTSKTFFLKYEPINSIGNTSFQTTAVLSDGTLLTAGKGVAENSNNVKVLFVKLESNGSVLWSKLVGRDSAYEGFCHGLVATPDGGFAALIGQYFDTFTTQNLPPVIESLAKFSSDGTVEWMRQLNDSVLPGPALMGVFHDLILTTDGELLVEDQIKFDLNGNLLWSRHSGSFIYSSNYKTAPYPDGGFVAVGQFDPGGPSSDNDIVRFDADGNQLWGKKLGLSFELTDIDIGPSGDIFILGRLTTNIPFSFYHTLLLKMSPNGDILWSKRYLRLPITNFEPRAFVATEDGGVTVMTHTRFNNQQVPPSFNFYRGLMHVDADGKIVWLRHYEDNFYGLPASISEIPGKGYWGICQPSNIIQLGCFKADPLGYAGECESAPVDIQAQDEPASATDFTLASMPGPVDFPPISLAVEDYVITLDTLCAPACPRGQELCNNSLDDDADGLFDCLDPDCDCPVDVCAPGEAKIWYFGERAGLDFNTEPPTVLADGAIQAFRATAVVCDEIGNLLFYSNGDTILNRFHQPMPNGIFVNDFPNPECIAVPHPGDNALYYLFTTRPFVGGLSYSLIDMRLDGGKGDIVPNQKGIAILQNDPKLTAVGNCSSNSYWLLAHGDLDNKFYAYQIDENGLSTNPVVSPGGGDYDSYGQMKFSPDGKRIARNRGKVIELYDFDLLTGLANNPVFITLPDTSAIYLTNTRGLEFSPNGQYLYVSLGNSEYRLIQIDLPKTTVSQTLNIFTELAKMPFDSASDVRFTSMQLAPDGKIYVVRGFGLYNSLSIVHRPNFPAPDCQFQLDGLLLAPTTVTRYGLVNFPQNLFAQPAVTFSQNAPDTICILDSTYTYLAEKSGCFQTDSILWKMEGLSGTLNDDHAYAWIIFDAPSEGQLIVTNYTECGIVADTLPIVVAEPFDKILALGPDRVLCDNGVFTFNAGSGFARYRWQNGSPDSVLTTLLPGKYWVDVWDACGNRQTDTVTVSIAPATVLALGDDQSGCPDLAAAFQRPGFFTSWQWSPSDFLSCDTCLSVTVSPAATTSWTVVAQTDDGCISVDTLTFEIQDTLFFQLDTSVCRGQSLALFGTTLPPDTTAYFFFQNPDVGCDTLLTVNVLGLDAPLLEIEETICANEFFTFNGIALPADTTAVFLLPGAGSECDSVVTVTVNSYPPLAVTLPPDTTLRIGATLILSAETTGTGTLIFTWSPADGLSCTDCFAPEISPLATTLYALQVTDANGCSASDSILVAVDTTCLVIIPNAFTPNGDGINDFFYPKTDPCVRLVRTWRVVSRWGETVFERQNFEPNIPNLGWNGNRANGETFPSDVLVWYAELEYFNGKKEVRKGDVTLLR
jgi:PKD repeat protein